MQFKQISSENERTIRKHESSKKRGETAYVMFIITQPLRPLFFKESRSSPFTELIHASYYFVIVNVRVIGAA